MRKIISIISVIFTFSCQAQNKANVLVDHNIKSVKINNMKIVRPLLTDSFEILDVKKYEDLGNLTKQIYVDENNNEIEYLSLNYESHEKGINYSLFGSRLSGYTSREIADSSYIQITKGYYPNGKLAIKVLNFNGDSQLRIGREYRFDKDGNLNYAMRRDEGYDFTFEQLLEYLIEEEQVPLKSGFVYSGDRRANIKMITESNKKIWQIIWISTQLAENEKEVTLKLDGKTGEVITRTERDAPLMEE